MEFFGYEYLFSTQWLRFSIAVAVISGTVSVVMVKLMSERPWQAFLLSCVAAYVAAFFVSGLKIGLSGGGEAVFWNALGAALFAPVWLPVCAIAHIAMRRGAIRRR